MSSCSKSVTFWPSVQGEVKKVFGVDVRLNPNYFVLGLDSNCERRYRYILRIALFAARLTILQKWLDKEPRMFQCGMKNLFILPLERLPHVLRGTLVTEWPPLAVYLKEDDQELYISE